MRTAIRSAASSIGFAVFLALGLGLGLGGCGAPSRTTQKTVDSSGGVISLEGVTLTVPRGALSGSQQITISASDESPPGFDARSPLYRLAPIGLRFAVPANLTIAFTGASDGVALYWSALGDEDHFGSLPSTRAGAELLGSIDHFSGGFAGTSLGADGSIVDAGMDLGASTGMDLRASTGMDLGASTRLDFSAATALDLRASLAPDLGPSIVPDFGASVGPDLNVSIAPDLSASIIPDLSASIIPDLSASVEPDLGMATFADLGSVGGADQAGSNPASCSDGTTDGDESDIDCGGASCAPCAPGAVCLSATDCDSKVCWQGLCDALPSCHDGVMNGKETDLDCGGPVCFRCNQGQPCTVGDDCLSGVCTAGACDVAPCSCGVGQGCYCTFQIGGNCASPPCAAFDGRSCLGCLVGPNGPCTQPSYNSCGGIGQVCNHCTFIAGIVDACEVDGCASSCAPGCWSARGPRCRPGTEDHACGGGPGGPGLIYEVCQDCGAGTCVNQKCVMPTDGGAPTD